MCVFRYIREMVLKSANMLRKSRICEKIWDEPTCCEQPSTARWRATFTKNRFASTRCEQPWGPTGSVHHFTKTIKSCKILPDLPKPARCAHNLTRCFLQMCTKCYTHQIWQTVRRSGEEVHIWHNLADVCKILPKIPKNN